MEMMCLGFEYVVTASWNPHQSDAATAFLLSAWMCETDGEQLLFTEILL